MESLFVFVVNHCDDKKPWCTAPPKVYYLKRTRTQGDILLRKPLKKRKQSKYWSQSYFRKSHFLGIKSFIGNGVWPCLIPVLTVLTGPCQWKWNCMEILLNIWTCLDLEPWGQQQWQLYSGGRPLPIFWRIDFPQNC